MKHLSDLFFLSMVACIVLAVVWTGIIAYLAWGPDPPVVVAGSKEHPRPKTHQVLPGDTVWSIYQEYYPGHDWEEIRYKIGVLNGLKNDGLRAYEVIRLPEVE